VTAPRRVVVVGFGMAGCRFLDELLDRRGQGASQGAITVIGAEPHPAYNRVLLCDVIAGRADVAALGLADPAGYAGRGVDVRLARHAVRVELPPGRPDGVVHLDDGTRIGFERLVLATGAAPVVPELAGLDPQVPPAGVHPLRTVDDALEIVAAAGSARRAAVLGGGLLGLEVARGLARLGLDVQVLHAADHLLPGVLDATGAGVLARALRRLRVPVRTRARSTGLTSLEGRLTGITLAGGAWLPADLLVLACGVRPRTGLAGRAGLAVRRGVLVDDALATSDRRVLAIGDCAEHDGRVAGQVAPAWEQARVAADLVSGADPGARYHGRPPAVRLRTADLDVAVVGEAAIDPWTEEPGLAVAQLLDPGRGRYAKVVVREGTVVGAAVVGDALAGAELRLLVERAAIAPADPAALLMPAGRRAADRAADGTAGAHPQGGRATVCRCNGVTRDALHRAWTRGARTPADLIRATRASTGCGGCLDEVTELSRRMERSPVAAGPVAG
jgi:assimilatory nitrate reductase electron transfer subunit